MADGRVAHFRQVYREARARGDMTLVYAMTMELRRLGSDPEPTRAPMETAVPGPLERAVPEPARRGGRPRMPRCEHGNIAERCVDCQEDEDR